MEMGLFSPESRRGLDAGPVRCTQDFLRFEKKKGMTFLLSVLNIQWQPISVNGSLFHLGNHIRDRGNRILKRSALWGLEG